MARPSTIIACGRLHPRGELFLLRMDDHEAAAPGAFDVDEDSIVALCLGHRVAEFGDRANGRVIHSRNEVARRKSAWAAGLP